MPEVYKPGMTPLEIVNKRIILKSLFCGSDPWAHGLWNYSLMMSVNYDTYCVKIYEFKVLFGLRLIHMMY